MHVFLCQKLPNTRAQNGATIRTAAVWCPTTSFKLHFPTLTIDNRFKHGNCATIAISIAGLERALLVYSVPKMESA